MDLEILTSIFLLLCAGLFAYFYYFGTISIHKNPDSTTKIVDDEQILRFKRAFQKQKATLIPNDYQRMNEYRFNENETLFDANAKSWNDDDIKIRELIQFGFKLLNKYAEDNSLDQCLRISTDIVLRVGRIVNKLLEINVVHANKGENKSKKGKGKNKTKKDDDKGEDETDVVGNKVARRDAGSEPSEKKINRHTFSVYIPRLMVMYEYIGNDECIKKYVCHPIITKMIHALNKSLDKTEIGSNMIQFAFPRLMTNYLFDLETYTQERNSELFQDLCKFYNITYNLSTGGPKNGVYEDGSCLYHNNVARYSNLFILLGFYEDLFASFGIDYNYHDVVGPIMDKLFHPDIPYPTFGLYNDDGERLKSMTGKLGIAIMPYIGLGLFKNAYFMFSLRVQRPGIAAFFKPAKDSPDTFALGWIQLRKMYLKNVMYLSKLTWESLKNEPGIILFEDQNECAKLQLKDKSNVYTENISSYIGRIPNEDVMFWMNEYQFTEYYQDIIITEMGVATNNGVEIFYCTNKNNPDGKQLLLRVKDVDNSILHCEPETSSGTAQLTTAGLTLKMVFDKASTVNIKRNPVTKDMEFEFNSNKYTVKVLTPNLQYMVVVTHEGTRTQIFGGTSKSELNDTMVVFPGTSESKTLVRSAVTYMYE